nr:sigma 54-interacting transcriptional regulator [Gammaproteobacteria bacterium]
MAAPICGETRSKVAETELLVRLLEGTADKTGEAFFRALVHNLAEALGTHGAWVTDYLPRERRLRARAFWLGGQWVENYEYDIAGTPCEPVVEQCRLLHVPTRVVELFPNDPDLPGMNAVSYTGMPFVDSHGAVIGHLAALDVKPLPETPRYLSVFRIFGTRAAAELNRLRTEEALRDREERLSRLIDGAMDGIIEFDADLRIRLINAAAAKSFLVEWTAEKRLSDLLEQASLEVLSSAMQGLKEAGNASERCVWLPDTLRGRRRDGRSFEIEASLSQIGAPSKPAFTLIFRDIQALREAKQRIRKLEAETLYLREELGAVRGGEKIIGRSPALLAALEAIRQVAETNATVMLLGESGTGKELFARTLQAASKRRDRPFITVNCAAIPAELVESEFFGHEKGAFTGATARRVGRFALADGGTIFLDEIGELPLPLQAKLLRVLQEGEFQPVGGTRTQRVDVRVIAATNRDLEEAVREGNFREDLYYRLNVFPIKIPALRERGDDVLLLAEIFRRRYARHLGREVHPLSEIDQRCLTSYAWPGNVRELQNILERAVITARNGELNLAQVLTPLPSPKICRNTEQAPANILTEAQLRHIERSNLVRALEACQWKVAGDKGAARLLGLSPSTLSSRMKALGVSRPSH